ncbi:MAG: hypothetical protein PWP34_1155 [Desulfuromonadales bacterium]|nr:hypothetical protein [Desulfuromonadales bacterium]
MKISDATFTVQPVSETANARPQPNNEQPTWKPGQVLEATVIGTNDGEVTLEMDGRQVMAHSRLALRAGQQLRVHVTTTSGEIQLQALGLNPGNRQEELLQLLGAAWKLPDLMRRIQTRDTSQAPLATIRNLLDTFMNSLENPGKGVNVAALTDLLECFGMAGRKSDEMPTKLEQTLKALLPERADEILQGLNLARQYNLQLLFEGITLLPLPLPFLEHGFLFAEQPSDKEDGSPAPTKLSLYLSLEKLGDMRVDMLWEEEDFLIKFTCEKPEALRELSAFVKELKQMLHFTPLREILFTAGKIRPDEMLMEYLGKELQGLVNTRI